MAIEHTDILGNSIQLGTIVAAPYRGYGLCICRILKITNKMVRIQQISNTTSTGILVYPKDTIKISQEDAALYLIKHS